MNTARRRFIAAAAALPAVLQSALAQSPPRRRMGILGIQGPENLWGGDLPRILRELARLGHVPGTTLEIRERYAQTGAELDQFAREFAALPVDLIFTEGTSATLAAQRATKVIPIVTSVGDPVAAGFARSLPRPGGNITGMSQNRAGLARGLLQLLLLLRPRLAELAILAPEGVPGIELLMKPMVDAASEAGIRVRKLLYAERGFEKRLAELKSARIDTAYCMGLSPDDPAAAIRHRIAVVAPGIGDVERGALIGTENDNAEDFARIAPIIDKVLRGQHPADVPFEVAARFLTAVNAKTAAALGIRLTQEILLRVDRVIG